MYHPDKHVDPLRKKEAEILFNKTKKAYEGKNVVFLSSVCEVFKWDLLVYK